MLMLSASIFDQKLKFDIFKLQYNGMQDKQNTENNSDLLYAYKTNQTIVVYNNVPYRLCSHGQVLTS
jgi:hypothetical protein